MAPGHTPDGTLRSRRLAEARGLIGSGEGGRRSRKLIDCPEGQ
jgi:hypothetical protein